MPEDAQPSEDNPANTTPLAEDQLANKPRKKLNGAKRGALAGLVVGGGLIVWSGIFLSVVWGKFLQLPAVLVYGAIGLCAVIMAGVLAGHIVATGLGKTKRAISDSSLLMKAGAVGGVSAGFFSVFILVFAFFIASMSGSGYSSRHFGEEILVGIVMASILGSGAAVMGLIGGGVAGVFCGGLSGKHAGTRGSPSFRSIAARRVNGAAVGAVVGTFVAVFGMVMCGFMLGNV